MAINKRETSLFVKIVIIVVAAAFAISITVPFLGVFGDGDQAQTTGGEGQFELIAARYQQTADSYETILASEPTSFTALVAAGNLHFDWALEVQRAAGAGNVQSGLDRPIWLTATTYYERALAVDPSVLEVRTDMSVSYFYGGRPEVAIDNTLLVLEADPRFPQALFNLGVFNSTLGRNADAIEYFSLYLEADPEGAAGDPQFAQEKIEELQAGAAETTPTGQ